MLNCFTVAPHFIIFLFIVLLHCSTLLQRITQVKTVHHKFMMEKEDMRKKWWGCSLFLYLAQGFSFPALSFLPLLPINLPGPQWSVTEPGRTAGEDKQWWTRSSLPLPPVMVLAWGSATLPDPLVLCATSSRHINTQKKLPALYQNMTQKNMRSHGGGWD